MKIKQKDNLVTIVVPAYNAEPFLKDNIESILGQTYKNLEVIYVCDGCTDNTVKILEEYKKDGRLQVVVQEKNQGAAVSRNIGMDMATGDWIIFFDADDLFEPDMIEIMLIAALENDADIAACYYQSFDDIPQNRSVIHNEMRKTLCETYPVIDVQKEASQIMQLVEHSPCVKLVQKSIYKRKEVFFQNIPNTNDVYYSLIAGMNAKRIVYVDKILLHYRSNLGRVTLSTHRHTERSYSLEAFDKIYEYISSEKKNIRYIQSFYNAVLTNVWIYLETPVAVFIVDELINKYLAKWGMDEFYIIEKYLNMVNQIIYKQILTNGIMLERHEVNRLARIEFAKQIASQGGSLWGTGQQGKMLMRDLTNANVKFLHVFDSAKDKWGMDYFGYQIENFDEVISDDILVTSSVYYEEIKSQIGNRASRIYNVWRDIWKIT